MRPLAVLVLMVLTSGCNMVVSEKPWFAPNDTIGAPPLRDGVWVGESDENCQFDEKMPIESWPECASSTVIRGSEWLIPKWNSIGEGRKGTREFSAWESTEMLVAAGDPLILQSRSNGDEPGKFFFAYAGLKPTAFDTQRKVTAASIWLVACGPIDQRRERVKSGYAEETQYVTDKPFSGLVVTDKNCVADSVASLRGAAKQSAALSDALGGKITQMHWVRDGWR